MSHTPEKPPRRKWPSVRKHVVKGITYWLVDCRLQGKGERLIFKTKQDADNEALKKRGQFRREGQESIAFPTDLRVEASWCAEQLAPYGATIAQATTYYVEHFLKYREAPPVKDVIVSLISFTEGRQRKRSPRTIEDLRSRLGKFEETFGERQLHTIEPQEIEEWLGSDPTLSARTLINDAVKVGQLYNFAIRHNPPWAETNVMERVNRPEEASDDAEPGILSVEECAALLKHAGKHNLLPYVCLALFAGLRRQEILRLDWAKINLRDRTIILGAGVTKKRQRRVAKINATLYRYLQTCVKQSGPVVELKSDEFPEKLDVLRKSAEPDGLKGWPANCLRHSFASYDFAIHGDPRRTALLLGHKTDKEISTFEDHYKALTTKSEAKRFWALSPTPADNVVVMPRAKAD